MLKKIEVILDEVLSGTEEEITNKAHELLVPLNLPSSEKYCYTENQLEMLTFWIRNDPKTLHNIFNKLLKIQEYVFTNVTSYSSKPYLFIELYTIEEQKEIDRAGW